MKTSSRKVPARAPCAPRGRSNPFQLVIACKCDNCEGELHGDGINAEGTQGFLICTACGCTYAIAARREIRR